MKREYVSGKLSAPVSRKVSGILKRISAVWGSGVELALEEFAPALELFPSAFFLYGRDACLPDLTRTLEEQGRFAGIPFLEKRTYTALSHGNLPFSKLYATQKSDLSLADPDVIPISLAYLSLQNPDENSELTRIVQRATKLAYS